MSKRAVEIEVTLSGGQTYGAVLASNSPVLTDLYAGLARHSGGDTIQPGVLIQLPLEEGRAAISFMSTSVVSIRSRPAVLIQHPQQAQPDQGTPAYVRIDDFLTLAENAQLFQYAIESQEDYEAASTTDAADHEKDNLPRRSRVLFSIQDTKWKTIFLDRLRLHMPHITATLGIPSFQFQKAEIQLTASNDGDFFKPHPDATEKSESVAGRVITFVYYLHRLPKPFYGGDLLLYGPDKGAEVTPIEPQNNCLVTFASNRWHEVDMVRCPSQDFGDSRFTINGWLHRGPG